MAELTIKQFMVDYFSKIDFGYWEMKVDTDVSKLRRLKTWKKKSPYIIDVYSAYIQLLEIFFINVFIFSSREAGFLHYLFINNDKLREEIEKSYNSPVFQKWFLDNFVFGMNEKESINNFQQKYSQHLKMLNEFYKDYREDYDFLNSYKHGYRVHANHEGAIRINGIQILKVDTVLTYFKKKDNTIYEMNLLFNHKRIVGKVYFLLYMLKNSQLVFLAQEKHPNEQIKFEHLVIENQEEWNESFGVGRTKSPLFHLQKTKYH